MSNQADVIFFGGDIITMDERQPTAEALAIKGDTILCTGNLDAVLALSGPRTQLIYLNQQTLLPGFIEPHQHTIFMARYRRFVNISGYYYDSYEKIEAKMKDEIAMVDAKADRVEWCVFFGWDPELVPDLPTLSADFLDELSHDVPIVVIGQSFHVAWVNHKAFEVSLKLSYILKARKECTRMKWCTLVYSSVAADLDLLPLRPHPIVCYSGFGSPTPNPDIEPLRGFGPPSVS